MTDGVTLVLPCLDEAESIARCITEAITAMAGSALPFEVLVVDNGSTDGSAALARAAGARVVDEPRPGYGSALRRGIAEAHTRYVVMADADCTYELSRLPDLVAPVVGDRADLVLGERLRSADNTSMPILHRLVGTPVLSWLARRAAPGLAVRDSQSGYRAFRRDQVLDLSLRGTGMEFASEMLIQAAHRGLRITEVATEYRPRVGESKLSTLRDGMRHLRLIVLLAPHLVLHVPGAVLLGAGLGLVGRGLVQPAAAATTAGAAASWQPVHLPTILATVGSLAIVAGHAIRHLSPLTRSPQGTRRHLRMLEDSALFGAVAVFAGLALDLGLLVTGAGPRRAPLAGLGASAIIVGAIVLVAGLVGQLIVAQLDYLRPAADDPTADDPVDLTDPGAGLAPTGTGDRIGRVPA